MLTVAFDSIGVEITHLRKIRVYVSDQAKIQKSSEVARFYNTTSAIASSCIF
ncbi:hypothetical protein [Nostoc sp.]|uniref:hypothetical protein n=1 Tax=Nostoc sp. TaxID=1180 RepID=UPI002FF59173